MYLSLSSLVHSPPVKSDILAPRDIKNLTVIGAGTMGTGIAIVAAEKGTRVTIHDNNPETLE